MTRLATFAALLLIVLSCSMQAQYAWPTENSWVGYTFANAVAVQDPQDVNNNNQSAYDLIFDPYNAPFTVQLASNAETVFFRLQVRSITSYSPGTYLIFIADGNGALLGKTYLTLTGNNGSIHVVDVANVYDQTTGSGSHASNIGGWARFGLVPNSTNYYVDFQVPRGILESVLGIVGPASLKFYAGTSTGGGNINNVNTDWMTPSTSGVPTAADFNSLGYTSFNDISNGVSPLPVELTSFSAYLKSHIVSLRWNTATEKNNFGFEIERRIGDGDWTKVGFVPGYGNSNSPKNYEHADDVTGLRGSVSYRLKQVDRDGTIDYSSTVMVNVAAGKMETISAYPNPFNPTTTVNFSLETSSSVRLALVDAAGREVLRVIDGTTLEAGAHSRTITADGIPSGRYFLVLQSAGGQAIHPVLLAK